MPYFSGEKFFLAILGIFHPPEIPFMPSFVSDQKTCIPAVKSQRKADHRYNEIFPAGNRSLISDNANKSRERRGQYMVLKGILTTT
jgi:hypothetical protein